MLEIIWSISQSRAWDDVKRFGVRAIVAAAAALLSSHQLPAQGGQRNIDSRLTAVWRQLGDTTLERLATEALVANNDVRAAQATVRNARVARRLVAFDFAPTVTLNAGLNRRRMSAAQFPGMPADFREQDIYDAGFDASWELDIFGRTRNTYKAQSNAASAADEDLRDVQLSLVSEVARTYFELRGAEQQMIVAERNVANQKRTLQLTVDRLQAGRGTAFDRERASAQVSTTLAGVASSEAQIAAAKYRLGVLVGHDPHITALTASDADDLEADEQDVVTLPDAPEFTAVSSLIARRPDVRSAEDRLAASRNTVAASRSEYLPRVSVVGAVGYNAGSTNTFGQKESSRFAIGPVLSWPAFNIGRTHTRAEGARALADASQARRDQAELAARAEVQAGIVTYERARTRVGLLRDAANSSERGAALARLRFDGGESGFLEVLDAQRSLLDAQDRLARGETDARTAYVALYKALGGAW